MLHIVTDGAADLPLGWQEQYNIQVIPVNIHFGEKTFLQYVDLDNEGFYRLVDESRRIPKTSQPSPHQFMEFYKKIAQPGDTILSIHVTSKLSGTYSSSVSAAGELAGQFNIIPFDSRNGSSGIALLCRQARMLEEIGKSPEEIVQYLEVFRSKIQIVLALDTLEYARMSGRVGAIQSLIASMLNVKPIARLDDGVLAIVGRVRTRRASLDRLVEMVKEQMGNQKIDLVVVHARDPKAGVDLMERAKQSFNIRDIFMTDLSISVAANLGPGTVGFIFYPIE